jgi:hypothetical protein
MVRNAITMHQFMPRTVTGIALRLGNNEHTWKAQDGGYDWTIHPATSAEEEARYREMGEIGYERWSWEVAVQFIRQDPVRFAVLTERRILAWWFGQGNAWTAHLHGVDWNLGPLKRAVVIFPLPLLLYGSLLAWRSGRPAGLLVAILFLYPLPYYFLFVAERYRFPTDPFMILMAIYAAVELSKIYRRLDYRQ